MSHLYQKKEYELSLPLGALTLKGMSPLYAGDLAIGLSQIEPWLRLETGAARLAHHFEQVDPGLNRFAVFLNGVLAGAVSVRFPWLRGPYLELLGLLPDAQGCGAGRAIMNWFESESPHETRNFWLLCSDFNDRALQFYRAMGYEKTVLIEGLYAEGFDDFLMRKVIK